MEKVLGFIAGIGLAILLMMLLAWPVMLLWNYALAPVVDGVNNISLGQALGLMVLMSLLFKTHVSNNKDA